MKLEKALEQFHSWNATGRGMHTQRNYKQWLNTFLVFMGKEKKVQDITHEDLIRYFNHLHTKQWSDNYISLHMVALKVFWRYITHIRKTRVPIELIRVPRTYNTSYQSATGEDAEKLLSVIDSQSDLIRTRDQLIIALLYVSGMRVSELCDLKMQDIELAEQKAFVRTKKNNNMRAIFWDDYTEHLMLKYLEERMVYAKSEHLIINVNRDPKNTGTAMTTRSIERLLRTYREKAGITKRIVPHSFRHGLGSDMARQGVHMRHIQKILGHNAIQSSMVYMQLNDEDLKETYKILSEKRKLNNTKP